MPRVGNNWSELAATALERERQQSTDETQTQYSNDFVCTCACHDTCHMCGSPFVGSIPHTNCADRPGDSIFYHWDASLPLGEYDF